MLKVALSSTCPRRVSKSTWRLLEREKDRRALSGHFEEEYDECWAHVLAEEEEEELPVLERAYKLENMEWCPCVDFDVEECRHCDRANLSAQVEEDKVKASAREEFKRTEYLKLEAELQSTTTPWGPKYYHFEGAPWEFCFDV